MKDKAKQHKEHTDAHGRKAHKHNEKAVEPEIQEPETTEKAKENEGQDWADAKDELTQKYEQLSKDYKELENKRMLLMADMDNQRKRFAKELESVRNSVIQDTIFPFIQVFEHFSMAVNAAQTSDNLKSLLDGMNMIQKEFDRAFSELGVEKINALGQEFNPMLHDAVAQEPSETVPAGQVIRQWSFGYKKGDRLLKPAMVVVSSGPPEA